VDALTFYFDRNFGKRFPLALMAASPPFRIEYHHSDTNRLKHNIDDDRWLELCGKKKWIAFSQDKLDKLPLEAMAVRQHNVAAFSLWGAQLPVWNKVCHFMNAYSRMNTIIKNEKPPYLYRVRSNLRFVRVNLP
jgi:PIN like domain